MKNIYTDLYADFSCVGGECPDTCCVDWDILVDRSTYDVYSALEEPLKSKICEKIEVTDADGQRMHKIRMQEDRRCPFLNEGNLCNIYIDCSPDAMCNTCKLYPRKIVRYYDTIMATVMTSCPEVVRMLLNRTEPLSFGFVEDSIEVDTASADWELYNELINGLVLTMDILQDREVPFWERLYLVMSLTYTIQNHIEEQKLSVLRANIGCYGDVDYRSGQIAMLPHHIRTEAWSFIYSLFDEVGLLTEKLPIREHQLIDFRVIERKDERKYSSWLENYRKVEKEIEYENLAVEFVFEYYMEALAGNNLFLAIIKMLLLLVMIRTSEIVEFNVQGSLQEADKVLLISNISRLMEHTPILNLIAERMIKNNETEQLFELAYLMR